MENEFRQWPRKYTVDGNKVKVARVGSEKLGV
jgi:hypothetical protein